MAYILEYKGYHTKVEIDPSKKIFYGKIEGITDLVNFEASGFDSVEKEFQAAVDDYLVFCEELGVSPEKEYKGSFNVRIAPLLHKKLALVAFKQGESLNAIVEKAIESYVNADSQTKTLQAIVQNALEVTTKVVRTNVHNSGREKIIPMGKLFEKVNYN